MSTFNQTVNFPTDVPVSSTPSGGSSFSSPFIIFIILGVLIFLCIVCSCVRRSKYGNRRRNNHGLEPVVIFVPQPSQATPVHGYQMAQHHPNVDSAAWPPVIQQPDQAAFPPTQAHVGGGYSGFPAPHTVATPASHADHSGYSAHTHVGGFALSGTQPDTAEPPPPYM